MTNRRMLELILSGYSYSAVITSDNKLPHPPFLKADTPYEIYKSHMGYQVEIINTSVGSKCQIPYWEPMPSYKRRTDKNNPQNMSLPLYMAMTDMVSMIVSQSIYAVRPEALESQNLDESPFDAEGLLKSAKEIHKQLSLVMEKDYPIVLQSLTSRVIRGHDPESKRDFGVNIVAPALPPYNQLTIPPMTTLIRALFEDVVWEEERHTDPLEKAFEVWLNMDMDDPTSYGLPPGIRVRNPF